MWFINSGHTPSPYTIYRLIKSDDKCAKYEMLQLSTFFTDVPLKDYMSGFDTKLRPSKNVHT